ncbi:SUKH-4 family immunity protein [Streptomyces kanamyceticus]|uniref:SUKH-4 family immunity protein n=1 Tax=Streptomyces kanamyceticus TaxID=1967 RepID=UPI0037DDA167
MNNSNTESPIFAMVRLVESDPGKGTAPIAIEVPRGAVGEVYRAADSLERTEVDGHSLLKFGSTGAFGSVLFDAESGKVLETDREARETALVNSSLEHFSACIESFINAFPFYESGEDDEEAEEAAQGIEDAIIRIDPDAYYEGSFWYEVRWSVAIGDFATEDLY